MGTFDGRDEVSLPRIQREFAIPVHAESPGLKGIGGRNRHACCNRATPIGHLHTIQHDERLLI